MNISYEEDKPVVKRDNLVIDGEVVGFMDRMEPDRYRKEVNYHCGFKLPGTISLIQGHGDTPENSINNCIIRAREDAQRLLIEIDRLEQRLAQ